MYLMTHIAVIACLLVCLPSNISGGGTSDSKSSTLNKLAQSLSKDDLFKLLRSAVDKKEKCSNKFSTRPNTILQVKKSEGAELLKHTFAISSYESCMQSCCEYSNGSQRCDLALYHDSRFDRDNSTAGCYLFQCYLPGKSHSVCETVPFEGYTLMERMIPADHQLQEMTSLESTNDIDDSLSQNDESSNDLMVAKADDAGAEEISQEIQDLSAAEESNVQLQDPSTGRNDDEMQQPVVDGSNTIVVVHDQNDGGDGENYQEIAEEELQVIQAEQSAILPLALGLAVAISILVMVACRVHIMKKRMQDKRYKYLKMDEEDYLINGMYL